MRKPLHTALLIVALTMAIIYEAGSRNEEGRLDAKAGAGNPSATSNRIPLLTVKIPADTPTDREFIERSKQAIVRHNLTKLPLEQLAFELVADAPPGTKLLNVRERHDTKSSGDPATGPRLFSVRLDVATGVLWTDALSVATKFEPLPK